MFGHACSVRLLPSPLAPSKTTEDGPIGRLCSIENAELIYFCCRAPVSDVAEVRRVSTNVDNWWSVHPAFRCSCYFKCTGSWAPLMAAGVGWVPEGL